MKSGPQTKSSSTFVPAVKTVATITPDGITTCIKIKPRHKTAATRTTMSNVITVVRKSARNKMTIRT